MNAARVLVIDDEPQIRRILRPSLTAAGYEVTEAATGHEALAAVAAIMPDLIILDLGLPDIDGKEVLRRLRVRTNTPVIVLSARDRETEKVMALDLGANDYVEKPFGMGELLARMRAALRHSHDVAADVAIIKTGALYVDVRRRLATKRGDVIHLTPKEFDLLAILARRAGQPLTHREILKSVWGPSHQGDSQYLRVLISQLRAKIEDSPGSPRIVVTDPGVGYRFVADSKEEYGR
jgi:two-component system, OmpR family, KDP operon response regulator KdpE